MFFFFHLLTGILLGLLLGDLLQDRRWIIPCVIGAVLPDLIDKPLGYLIFPTIGYGRFIFHNLILFFILLIAGYLLWKYSSSPVILALDIGILSHQILDSMWFEPKMWLYPLFGTAIPHSAQPSDYIFYLLETDLTNPTEWIIVLICICGFIVYLYRTPLAAAANRHKRATRLLLKSGEIFLLILCGIVIFCAFQEIPFRDLAVYTFDQYLMLVAVLALAALLLFRRETGPAGSFAGKLPQTRQEKCPPGPGFPDTTRLERLLVLTGKDPAKISIAEAKQIAYDIFPSRVPDKKMPLNGIIAIPGTSVIAAIAGCILLSLSGKVWPADLLALGAVSAGLFIGCCAMVKTKNRNLR
ncbi:MAG: metal-dependent hydrolase [Methanoregula sp.]|nr:metal-dependent hydrolase [Methanoregula sp.]